MSEDNITALYLAMFAVLLVVTRFFDNDISRYIANGIFAIAFFIAFYFILIQFTVERKSGEEMYHIRTPAFCIFFITLLFSIFMMYVVIHPGRHFLIWDSFTQGILYYAYAGIILLIFFIWCWILLSKKGYDTANSFDFSIRIVFFLMFLMVLGIIVTWFVIFIAGDTLVRLLNKEIGF